MKLHHKFFILCFMPGAIFAQWSYTPFSIQMRDNKFLAADLYCIDTTVQKPTILVQTPYNKVWYRYSIGYEQTQFPYDSMNYNYLIVDWRGFYGSVGAESLGYDRGLDGYDLCEWIAAQSWSNGKIGTWGASALGVIQFQTAKHRPPHLTCSTPIVSDYKIAYTDYFSGGDYLKELTAMRDSLGFTPESLILAHYKYDIYWMLAEMLTDYPESVSVPMLMVTGWYDHNKDAPLEAFYGLRNESDTLVRDRHKIIIGPWTHGECGRLEQGELTYPGAVDTLRVISLRFFDHYLRNINNGYQYEPIVRFFELGSDCWDQTDDWYGLSDRDDTLYIAPEGQLAEYPPSTANPPDSFAYDPRDPSPSHGGIRFDPFNPQVIVGPRDQTDSVESRPDVKIFTTPVMTKAMSIVGQISAKLNVSSNCEDTDISLRLTDIYPDGRSMLITEGIRRMRFRNSYSAEELMVPGDTYAVAIDLQNISYCFLPGHRIRLIIGSANYPIYDINLNNGDSLYVPGDTVIAINRIYHEPLAQSFLILKVRNLSVVNEYISSASCNNYVIHPTVIDDMTKINFKLEDPQKITIELYDALGRKAGLILDKELPKGAYEYSFDKRGLIPGVYFVAFKSKAHSEIKKIIIIR